jgi:hypothetical protein
MIAGHDQAEIARLVGVAVRTVRGVEAEPAVTHIDGPRAPGKKDPSRTSSAG